MSSVVAPWSGRSSVASASGLEMPERLGQRRAAQLRPDPLPPLPVGCCPGRSRRLRAAGTGSAARSRRALRRSPSSASLSWGQDSTRIRREQVARLGLGFALRSSSTSPAYGRGRRRTASRLSSRPASRAARASRRRPVRRHAPGRSRSRPCTGCTGSPKRLGFPAGPRRPWGRRARTAGRPPGRRRQGVEVVAVERPDRRLGCQVGDRHIGQLLDGPADRRPAVAVSRAIRRFSPPFSVWRNAETVQSLPLCWDQKTPRYCNSASGRSSGGHSSVARKVGRLTPGR